MSEIAFAAVVAIFPLLVVFAAASDFFTMRISNVVSGGLFVAGAIALAWSAPGWMVAGQHVAASVLVLTIGYILFCFRQMGGGDIKFAAAIALWLGLSQAVEFVFAFSIYGGVLTVAVLLADRALSYAPVLRVGFLAMFPEKQKVPYGIALSAAAMQVFAQTDWMKALMIG